MREGGKNLAVTNSNSQPLDVQVLKIKYCIKKFLKFVCMPTVLVVNGFRFFFYSNENNEPIHIHIEKAEASAKYWLNPIEEVYSMNLRQNKGRKLNKLSLVILTN